MAITGLGWDAEGEPDGFEPLRPERLEGSTEYPPRLGSIGRPLCERTYRHIDHIDKQVGMRQCLNRVVQASQCLIRPRKQRRQITPI